MQSRDAVLQSCTKERARMHEAVRVSRSRATPEELSHTAPAYAIELYFRASGM